MVGLFVVNKGSSVFFTFRLHHYELVGLRPRSPEEVCARDPRRHDVAAFFGEVDAGFIDVLQEWQRRSSFQAPLAFLRKLKSAGTQVVVKGCPQIQFVWERLDRVVKVVFILSSELLKNEVVGVSSAPFLD